MYCRPPQTSPKKIPFMIEGARTMGSVWIAIYMTQSVNVKSIAVNFKEHPK